MSSIMINLSELINDKVTTITGRQFGVAYAEQKKLLEHIKNNEQVEIIISDKVAAINDSFIKGFFNEVFKFLKSKDKVAKQITITADSNFKNLFDKNWTILESIYHAG